MAELWGPDWGLRYGVAPLQIGRRPPRSRSAAPDRPGLRSGCVLSSGASIRKVVLGQVCEICVAEIKDRLVVLSGAGISAESGIKTFRDSDGLWEGHNVNDVATPEAWRRNPGLVLDFYNERRRVILAAEPNEAHKALGDLEETYDVSIVTQNIDDLHERAGSSNVLHLHGEILFARSSIDPDLIYPLSDWAMRMGDLCELGGQLRPHIVWFGEDVPMMDRAIEIVRQADILVVIGTSLAVYPAASLIDFARPHVPIYVVDPGTPALTPRDNVHFIKMNAVKGVLELKHRLEDFRQFGN
ncbi:MAG: NAD-dependent deacylase [Bdellovibrionales bacterium]|nr:NAD-dependent deacylase [Bdellovibrionales bacterium]